MDAYTDGYVEFVLEQLEEAKALVLRDLRVASRARETKGFDMNIGKYVSLAYLEAEAASF